MELVLIVLWLGLFLGLGALALPFASLLFSSVADRGAGLAIPLSFAVVAFTVYWLGQVRFGLVSAVGAVIALGGLSALSVRRGVSIDTRRFRSAIVVFTLAYLFLILIRLFRPGAFPGGGEKFLDFGLLASLLRTDVLPPEDMWFAGKPVRYYYGGHMLAATFATLTDTAPRYAYNTALAGYYAAYVTAAWGLAGALSSELDRPYWLGGALGAFFVGLASNLSTPARLLVWILPRRMGGWVADLLGIKVVGLATGPMHFNYWYASRVIDGDVAGDWQLITEFPFFAFLNGDLHGHMMSPVFLLLGVGLSFAIWKRPATDRSGRLLRLLAIAPLIGLLIVTNTWSAPALFGMTALALVFAPGAPWTLLPNAIRDRIEASIGNRPLASETARIAMGTGLALVVTVLGALSVYPFLLGAASGRSIGLLPTPRSGLGGLLLVYGAFLAISAAYLAGKSRHRRSWKLGVIVAVLLVGSTFVRAPAVGLFLPPLLGGWYLLRTREDVSFELVLLVGALGLLLLVEFVYVIERAGPGRMNTVFKISAQAWALLSVAGGVMGAWLVGPNGPGPALAGARRTVEQKLPPVGSRDERESNADEVTTTKRTRLATVLFLVLIVSLSIYPVLGTIWAIGSGTTGPTLDAHAYIHEEHPEEASAIRWLANRSGQPNMVSAPGTEIYRWVNAPSSMTGIPTVAGWVHEVGYRGPEPYWDRVRDVEIIFETSDPRSRRLLLERYNVTYIYVGPIERERYELPNITTESGISVAYSDTHVTIYRVNRSIGRIDPSGELIHRANRTNRMDRPIERIDSCGCGDPIG
ncbi:MAG: DUF2298 domain-containing protein [Halodesulfurarchaeum sp.]